MWDINPLGQENLMQDLCPLLEDMASFFSSNRKMRKSGNCWTVALTGIIAYNGSAPRVRVNGKLSRDLVVQEPFLVWPTWLCYEDLCAFCSDLV